MSGRVGESHNLNLAGGPVDGIRRCAPHSNTTPGVVRGDPGCVRPSETGRRHMDDWWVRGRVICWVIYCGNAEWHCRAGRIQRPRNRGEAAGEGPSQFWPGLTYRGVRGSPMLESQCPGVSGGDGMRRNREMFLAARMNEIVPGSRLIVRPGPGFGKGLY